MRPQGRNDRAITMKGWDFLEVVQTTAVSSGDWVTKYASVMQNNQMNDDASNINMVY